MSPGYDKHDPINTPRGLHLEDDAIKIAARQALALAMQSLDAQGLDYSKPWGQIQVAPRGDNALYADVSNWHLWHLWHLWDPDTKAASINGLFQAGTTGTLTPPKGMTVPMLITSVVANRSFTVESKIPLFRMVFEHELLPASGATKVVQWIAESRNPP